jgi:hypothetical protein
MAASEKAVRFLTGANEGTGGLSADIGKQALIEERRLEIIARREQIGKELRLERHNAAELVTSISNSAAVRGAQEDPHTAVAKRDYVVDFMSANPANLIGKYHAFKIRNKFPIPGAAVFDDFRRRKLLATTAAIEDRIVVEQQKREAESLVRVAVTEGQQSLHMETKVDRLSASLAKSIATTEKALEMAGELGEHTIIANEEQVKILNWVRQKKVFKVEEAFEQGEVLVNAVEPSMQNTGLMLAVQAGLLSVTRLYLRYGADPNRCNLPGQVPLHVAWSSWLRIAPDLPRRPLQRLIVVEMVKELLRYGAAPNSINHKGQTALHFAANYGHDDILLLLLQGGGDPELADRFGQTPINCARERLAHNEQRLREPTVHDDLVQIEDTVHRQKACIGLLLNWHHVKKSQILHDFRSAWSHSMAANATEFREADADARRVRGGKKGSSSAADAVASLRSGDSNPLHSSFRRAQERLWGRQSGAVEIIRGLDLQEEMRLRNHLSKVDVTLHPASLPPIPQGGGVHSKPEMSLHEGASDVESDDDFNPAEEPITDDDNDAQEETDEGLAAEKRKLKEQRRENRKNRRRSIVGTLTAPNPSVASASEVESARSPSSSIVPFKPSSKTPSKETAAAVTTRADGRLGIVSDFRESKSLIEDTTEAEHLAFLRRKDLLRTKWSAMQRDLAPEVEARIRRDLHRDATATAQDVTKEPVPTAAMASAADAAAATDELEGFGSVVHESTDRVFIHKDALTVDIGIRAVRDMRRRQRESAMQAVTDAKGIFGRKNRMKAHSGEVYIRKPALDSVLLRPTRMRVDNRLRSGPAPLAGVYSGARTSSEKRNVMALGDTSTLWGAGASAQEAANALYGGALGDTRDDDSERPVPEDDSVMGRDDVEAEQGGKALEGAMKGLAVGVSEAEVQVLKRTSHAPMSRQLLPIAGSAPEQEQRAAAERRQAERRMAEAASAAERRRKMNAKLNLQGAMGGAKPSLPSGARKLGALPEPEAGESKTLLSMFDMTTLAGKTPKGGKPSKGRVETEGDSPVSFGPLHMAGSLPASGSLIELSRYELLDDVPGKGITKKPVKTSSALEEVRRRMAAEREASGKQDSSDAKYGVLHERREAARLTRFGRFPIPEEPHRFVEFDASKPVPDIEM